MKRFLTISAVLLAIIGAAVGLLNLGQPTEKAGDPTLGGISTGGIAKGTVNLESIGVDVKPNANNTLDIGAFGSAWKDIYVSGTLNIGSLAASSVVNVPLYVTNGTATTTLDISGTNNTIQSNAGQNLMLIPSTTQRMLIADTVSTTLHLNDATGNENAFAINYTTNKETSGNDTGLLINHVDTASPGSSYLFDFQLAGTSRFNMLNDGTTIHTVTGINGGETGFTANITTEGSTTGNVVGYLVNLNTGYTGAGLTEVLGFDNNVAGTNSTYSTDTTYGSRPAGNRGIGGFARGSTAGHNVGGLFLSTKGNVNYGVWSAATVAKNSATNVGIIGLGRNTGTSPTEIGVYALLDDVAAVPIFNTSTALLADANTSNRNPLVIRKQNSTVLLAVYNNGNIDLATSSVQMGIQDASESGAGGELTIKAGKANTSGVGGNITLVPGAAAGGGNAPGVVVIADAASGSDVGAFGSQTSGDFSIYTQSGVNQISLSTSGATDSIGFRVKPVASGVNFLEATNAVTTDAPSIYATGTDANIGIDILNKGTGSITMRGNIISSANNTYNLGGYGGAWADVYASSSNIFFSGLGAPSVTDDLVCWEASGQLTHQATNCTVSDLRKKTNISSWNRGLELIRQLKPIVYDEKNGGRKDQIGLGAQDVAKIDTHFVVPYKEGEEGYPGWRTVDYMKLTMPLVNAVKELDAKVEKQQKEIESLKREMRTLKSL